QKQKKLIMLPSETMIWQPEFTDKTLSRKTGAVHESDLLNHGFTREMAEDALGKQFVQAREEHLELQQQRDNSQDMH
ncbi:hypothetical protein ACRW6N_18140, partial [Escherichia coli]